MKCLRCGYCCINYDVVIVVDPDKPLTEENLKHKPSGEKCQHLLGNAPGEYSCAIHLHPVYAETPCADFTQTEDSPDSSCRMGEYILTLRPPTKGS